MANDKYIYAMFALYVFVTVKQAQQILGCKFDYINVRLRRLEQTGFLGRVQQNDFAPFVYFLSKTGAERALGLGVAEEPRYISKKSLMQIPHDIGITECQIALFRNFSPLHVRRWRADLHKFYDGDLPDLSIDFHDGWGWSPFEYVRTNPVSDEKLAAYATNHPRTLIVLPTIERVKRILTRLEESLPTSKLWFTYEEKFLEDPTGKVWWTPKNFRDRVYSILKPEA